MERPEWPRSRELLHRLLAMQMDWSESEMAALRVLTDEDEPLTPSELAESYSYSDSTASRNLRDLTTEEKWAPVEATEEGYVVSDEVGGLIADFLDYRDDLEEWDDAQSRRD